MAQEGMECVEAECCHMCFSTERKLTSLDGVVDVYLLIVGLTPSEESVKGVRSCWECRAVLQRIHKFRRQAQWARDVLITADALLLDSDTCLSRLKVIAIENINVKPKLNLDIVRNVVDVEISPKCTENVNELSISAGKLIKKDDKGQCIEDNTGATNMYQAEEKELFFSTNTSVGIDPLALDIKEEDEIDEGDFFDEPLCDQNESLIDRINTKTYMRKCNNLISNITTVEKDYLSQNCSNNSTVKPFIDSKVLDDHIDGKTKYPMIVIHPKINVIRKGEKDTTLSVNLDKSIITTRHPERNNAMAHRENINTVNSMKSEVNIHKIQSNRTTVSNINISKNESQKKILHNTTTAQNSQIDSTFLKPRQLMKRVQSNGTEVKGNFMHMALTPRENVKPDENVKPGKDRTRKKLPGSMKALYESFPLGTTKSGPVKIIARKVTKSELNDFLEQARNNEAYLSSPFKCEYCILGFKEKRFLQRHMSRYRHAKISKNNFVCNICLSSMPSEKKLNIHRSKHDCLYSCTHEDFTSVLMQNVYHHYVERHQLSKKFKTSVNDKNDEFVRTDGLTGGTPDLSNWSAFQDTCQSNSKFTLIEKTNLNPKLKFKIIRNMFEVKISPKYMENASDLAISGDTKAGSARSSSADKFVKQDDKEQCIEDNTSATNMYGAEEKELFFSTNTSVGIDPLAMEIKEKDGTDEGDIFDEPLCDQNQTNIDEQPISKYNNIKTYMKKSNKISPVKTVQKDDFSQNSSNDSTVKPFIISKVSDHRSYGKTKSLMNVMNSEIFSKNNVIREGEKETIPSDNLDKEVITTERRENIDMVDSTKSQLNIHNIPSNSLQSIDTKLDKIQSNLTTITNTIPSHDEIRKEILHNTTTAQTLQRDPTLLKTRLPKKRVQSHDTAVKGNFMQRALTLGELEKPVENVKPVMDRTRKNVPGNKKVLPVKIKARKVTKSELNDFLEQARNSEAYLSSPFKCEYCILGFKEERFLQRHMSRYRHATILKKDFQCNICLSSRPSEKELNIHQSTHDCLYSCTRDDFTSVSPLNVFHHFLEKHPLKRKLKTTAGNEPSAKTTAGTKKKTKRKNKLQRNEVFKPTVEDFDYMRMMISLRPGVGRCMDCCLTFRHNDALFEHCRAHSEIAGEHMCDLCRLRFKTAELLNEHKPVHDKWYRCKADPNCHYVAQSLNTVRCHINLKHPIKSRKRKIRPEVPQECDVCKKVFTNRNSLKSHMLIHNKQHMCEECGHVCASSSNLIQHKQKHITRDYLFCELCPKRFYDAKALKYHRNRHLQVKPYACKMCDEKFYSTNMRFAHMSRVHKKNQKIKKKRYQCSLCRLEFPTEASLTAHRATHEELERYKCDKCPRSFFLFNSLVNHQESHVHAHKCDICGKVFVTKDNLEYHLRSKHSGGTEAQPVKPVKIKKQRECNECGKVFQSKKNWQDHMKTHLIFSEDMPELS